MNSYVVPCTTGELSVKKVVLEISVKPVTDFFGDRTNSDSKIEIMLIMNFRTESMMCDCGTLRCDVFHSYIQIKNNIHIFLLC